LSPTAPARRVAEMDDLERAGDYCLDQVLVKGEPVPQVWFLLPIHEGDSIFERPTEGSGLHGISSPPWTFRECDDGSLEIRASILCGRTDERPEGYFHGFLNEGNVWSWS
jgi:hypothetical protein